MATKDLVREKIFELISRNGKWWIRKIARELDISPETASRHVEELEEKGRVEVTEGYKSYVSPKDE